MMWFIFLVVAVLVFIFLLVLMRERKLTAFGKEVIYVDSLRVKKQYPDVVAGKLLEDKEMGISGKPDYILKSKDGKFIPIEIKSGENKGDEPYPGDKMQLAAYMVLTKTHFGPVAHGEIHYNNKKFIVQNTSDLINELKEVVKATN